jgi:dTMP kinase|tara:strand:- start:97 stop:729 length:633 start_codon:yes stop_codon:yes gene_type:complete
VSGQLITFEGSEGCGKTTQITMLAQRLEGMGKKVVITREPGGTLIGEKIRTLLQDPANTGEITPITELLLFSAARAELVEQIIKPALERGEIVICDRFFDSTFVYQGIARSIDLSVIDQLKAIAVGSLKPDLTLLLDLDPEAGIKRAGERQSGTLDRIEAESLEFFKSVRQAYLDLAVSEPDRFTVIDGELSVEAIEAIVGSTVEDKLFN